MRHHLQISKCNAKGKTTRSLESDRVTGMVTVLCTTLLVWGYLPTMSLRYCNFFRSNFIRSNSLLGDGISVKAETLLDSYIANLQHCMGKERLWAQCSQCGRSLGVLCQTLATNFCKELFGFEDWNAVILQAVHGTGDVTRQILCHVSAQLQLKGFFFFFFL